MKAKVKHRPESVLITVARTEVMYCTAWLTNITQQGKFTMIKQMRFAKAMTTSIEEKKKLDTLQ